MSWETIKDDRGQILLKLEDTEGADPAPVAGQDDVAFTEFAWSLDPEFRERQLVNAFGPGFLSDIGRIMADWTGTADLQAQDIVVADGSDDPSWSKLLQIAGWTVTRNATDKTVTFWLTRDAIKTATIKVREPTFGADAYNEVALLASMADFNLQVEAGVAYLLGLSGKSKADLDAMFGTVGSVIPEGSILPTDPIVRAENCVVRLYDQAADVLYGGGTLAAPDQALALISYNLSGNRNLVDQRGVAGAHGIQRRRPNVDERPGGTMLIEATRYSDFNPYKLMGSLAPIYFGVDVPISGDTTMRNGQYIQITGAPQRQEDQGNVLWSIPFAVVHPGDVNAYATTPAASKPGQVWAKGTGANAGLGLLEDANITPPAGALAFIQIHTQAA